MKSGSRGAGVEENGRGQKRKVVGREKLVGQNRRMMVEMLNLDEAK